jgi:hypothetical protein
MPVLTYVIPIVLFALGNGTGIELQKKDRVTFALLNVAAAVIYFIVYLLPHLHHVHPPA